MPTQAIALLNPRDELHEEAVTASKVHSSDRILTNEMVLAEFLNSFAGRGPQLRLAVAKAVETLRGNRNVVIFPQTSDQFEQALLRYRDTSDKSWSLADCSSFLIMEAESIPAALTHDQHFEQAGFQALLR